MHAQCSKQTYALLNLVALRPELVHFVCKLARLGVKLKDDIDLLGREKALALVLPPEVRVATLVGAKVLDVNRHGGVGGGRGVSEVVPVCLASWRRLALFGPASGPHAAYQNYHKIVTCSFV